MLPITKMYQQSFNFYRPGTKEYYLEKVNQIIARNKDRISNLNKKIDTKLSITQQLLEEFVTINYVWKAANFAGEHEPDKNFRGFCSFCTYRYLYQFQEALISMYPKSKSDIKKMNKKQARRAYDNIMYFLIKSHNYISSLES